MSKKMLTIRAPESELEMLAEYARRHGRTKTEIVREFLRSLKRKSERPVSAGVSARSGVSARPTPKSPKKAKS
jgi:Ribbon-helix-helix protein, copG family